MPFPIAAAIGAGANLLGGVLSNASTARQNRLNREFAVQQRDYMNDYNSPAKQMQRLKEAGLNPNLVYGAGSGGGIMPSANAQYEGKSADWSSIGRAGEEANKGILLGQTLRKIEAETNLTKEKVNLTNAQTANAALTGGKLRSEITRNWRMMDGQVDALALDNERKEIDNSTRYELNQHQLKVLAESIKKLQLENEWKPKLSANIIESSKNQNFNRSRMVSQSISESLERIKNFAVQRAKTDQERKNLEAAYHNIKNSGTLQELDIQLRREGINPNDPSYIRILTQQAKKMLSDSSKSKWGEIYLDQK